MDQVRLRPGTGRVPDPAPVGRVCAWIDRPTGSIIVAPDPVQSALDDVTALVAALRRRFALTPAPDLPSYQALRDPHRDQGAISAD